MPESTWNLLSQVPLAGVVVLVVVLFLKHLKATSTEFMIALAEQRIQFMQAIKEQRNENNAAAAETARVTAALNVSINDRMDRIELRIAEKQRKSQQKGV